MKRVAAGPAGIARRPDRRPLTRPVRAGRTRKTVTFTGPAANLLPPDAYPLLLPPRRPGHRPTAAPADQLPKLRKLLETVLRDECKAAGIPFVDLSQAIGLVAYGASCPPPCASSCRPCAWPPTWWCTKATPAPPPKPPAGFAAVAALVLHLTGAAYDGPAWPQPLARSRCRASRAG